MAIKWTKTIPTYEVHGSRRESFIATGGSPPMINVRLAVAETQKYDAVKELLGQPGAGPQAVNFPGGSGCPFILYPVAVNITFDGGKFDVVEGEILETTWAFLDVTYVARLGVYERYISYDGNGGSLEYTLYIEDRIEPRTEYRPYTNRNLHWTATGQAPIANEIPTIPVPGHTLIHTVSGFPFIPLVVAELEGTVAAEGYMSRNLRVPYGQETLMLRSVQILAEWTQVSYDPVAGLDVPTYTITGRYEFKDPLRGDAWNKFRRTDTGVNGWTFDTLTVSSGPAAGTVHKPFPVKSHIEFLF